MSALLPAAKPGTPVACASCAHQFAQDPPFSVACPDCKAPAGSYCHRPSEHAGPLVPFHKSRDLEALKQGYYDHPVGKGCGPISTSRKAQQILYLHTHQTIQESLDF